MIATTLNQVMAYWYACGYNDHRRLGEPYVVPDRFMEAWEDHCNGGSRPSLQEAFRRYVASLVEGGDRA